MTGSDNRVGGFRAAALSALAVTVAATSVPGLAQDSADARLRRIESEVRALQRKVFPGGDSKFFPPEITAPPAAGSAGATAAPASNPVTDALKRMDAIEAQIARITGTVEQNDNRLRQIEAKLGIVPAAAGAAVTGIAPAVTVPATASISAAGPAATGTATAAPAASPVAASPAAVSSAAPVATPAVAPVPTPPPATVAKPSVTPVAAVAKPGVTASPSAQRLAAVRAVEKPQTDDPGDDEYSYGFRLWEAKFYPEAQQQLKMFVAKYPRHTRMSFARNLLGRAYLDEGNAREAASWFLQNYNGDKAGARAPDSLLFLAVAMKQMRDTNRACIALAEFSQSYPAEAAGRLKSLADETRAGLKCNS